MAVLSYLIFPYPGKKDQLHEELSLLPDCDIIPAENKDLLVLVTESTSREQDDAFRERMEALPSLAGFSLVAGFGDDSTSSKGQL